MNKILFLFLFLFLGTSLSYSQVREIRQETIPLPPKKPKVCIKVKKNITKRVCSSNYVKNTNKVTWVLPKNAESVTIYYRDNRGKLQFSRTLSVTPNYIIEMRANEKD
mgnify:CR=1 FL=1